MKRLDKHQSKEFGPVKITLTDLQEVLSILGKRDGLELVADDVQYDSLEEMARDLNGRSPATVSIKASNPYLHVNLTRISARLFASSSNLEASGLFLQIDRLLQRCERKPRYLYSTWRVMLFYWVTTALTFFPAIKPYSAFLITIQVLFILWLMRMFFIQMRRYSYVQTDTPDTKSFWARNSDSIIVAVISTMIGAMLGAIATKAVDHSFPQAVGTRASNEISSQE